MNALRNLSSEIVFMALAIWRESRGECREAQEAVAMCIINRVQSPKWWGNDILSVIFKAWQFSSITDPRDKQLIIWPSLKLQSWQLATEISYKAIKGMIKHPAPNSDSYFDDSIKRPNWATDKNFVKKIGKLNFHNIDNDYEKVENL